MTGVVFLTLLLGLVDGRQTVELAATEDTARIELRLDDEIAAVITGGPPWRAPVQLGALAPHRLEAVAFDAEGRELGRAEQWLNLPRARAEVSLLVDITAPGEAVAEIGWSAVGREAPESVAVSLDGVPVTVPAFTGSSLRVPLPPHDADVLHVVSAEVVFAGDEGAPQIARADVAFGAPYGDQVSTQLTGVAVEVDGRRRLREPAEAGRWLQVDGETPPVVAVDSGEADLYAVVDAGAHPELNRLAIGLGRMIYRARPGVSRSTPNVGRSRVANSPLHHAGMMDGDRLFLVRPQVESEVGESHLFGVSQPLDNTDGGSAWQLSYLRMDPFPDQPQRLADAVATAGMRSVGASRPRGLVVVLGPDTEDRSGLDPARVRAYLKRIGVPLLALYVDLGVRARKDSAQASEEHLEAARREHLAAARSAWGEEVVDVEAADDWFHAFTLFRRQLARQRVLWIEGRYAPQAVRLHDAPNWLRKIGGEADDEAPQR